MSYTYLKKVCENSTCSQEQAEESWEECCSDTLASAQLKSSHTAETSCCNDKETEFCLNSLSGTMCELSMESSGVATLMSSAEASPVKTLPSQEKAQESMAHEADCGLNLQESLAKYNPYTSLWRTRQLLLLEDSGECLETFPKWGIMQNGALWELPTLGRSTSEKESGFWRTPRTITGGTLSEEGIEALVNKEKRASGHVRQMDLQDQVRDVRLYPTPIVCGNNNRKGASKTSGDGLETVIQRMTYPTPLASDWKDRGNLDNPCVQRRLEKFKQITLSMIVQTPSGQMTPQMQKARLNPNWVEWLMGWTIGWTDLKPLAMDKFQSWLQAHSN